MPALPALSGAFAITAARDVRADDEQYTIMLCLVQAVLEFTCVVTDKSCLQDFMQRIIGM